MDHMVSFMVLEFFQMVFVRFSMQDQGICYGKADHNQDKTDRNVFTHWKIKL